MEVNSTVNLVPFGYSITEQRMHENRNYVYCNSYAHSICAHPIILGSTAHYTMCLDFREWYE